MKRHHRTGLVIAVLSLILVGLLIYRVPTWLGGVDGTTNPPQGTTQSNIVSAPVATPSLDGQFPKIESNSGPAPAATPSLDEQSSKSDEFIKEFMEDYEQLRPEVRQEFTEAIPDLTTITEDTLSHFFRNLQVGSDFKYQLQNAAQMARDKTVDVVAGTDYIIEHDTLAQALVVETTRNTIKDILKGTPPDLSQAYLGDLDNLANKVTAKATKGVPGILMMKRNERQNAKKPEPLQPAFLLVLSIIAGTLTTLLGALTLKRLKRMTNLSMGPRVRREIIR